jgi:hypothetical protein
MAPEGGTASLNRMYRTSGTDRGQTGTTVTHEPQADGNTSPGLDRMKGARGMNSAGRKCWRPSWPVQ